MQLSAGMSWLLLLLLLLLRIGGAPGSRFRTRTYPWRASCLHASPSKDREKSQEMERMHAQVATKAPEVTPTTLPKHSGGSFVAAAHRGGGSAAAIEAE